jgi:hypothetical protein
LAINEYGLNTMLNIQHMVFRPTTAVRLRLDCFGNCISRKERFILFLVWSIRIEQNLFL